MLVVNLEILNQSIELRTNDESLADTLRAIYSPFVRIRASPAGYPESSIEISVSGKSRDQVVTLGTQVTKCETTAELLYTIDKIITIELQVRRPDLYFVHAAVLSTGTHAILVAGESGAGKSTLCWSLCDAGCRYLSDELAPVFLTNATVQPFPRAIALKRLADASPPLPKGSIDATATKYIPANSLPAGYEMTPLPISSIVFLVTEQEIETPGLVEISAAEVAARLYSNGLNQLAHEDDGLKAAAKLAANIRGLAICRKELSIMTAMIMNLANQE